MFDAGGIASIVLAAILLLSAIGKLTQAPQVVANLALANVEPPQFKPLAAIELVAVIGLIIGLWWTPLGVAAAVGTTIYFIGAIAAHLRNGNRDIGPAAFLLALSVAVVLLQSDVIL